MSYYDVFQPLWADFGDLLGLVTLALVIGLSAVFVFSVRGLVRESERSNGNRLLKMLFGRRPRKAHHKSRQVAPWRIAAERVDAQHHPLDIQVWEVFEPRGRPVMGREPLGARDNVRDLDEAA